MEGTTAPGQVPATTSGNGRAPMPAPGTRTSDEIRRDIESQRGELARSVDALRVRWGEVTDVSAQIRKHRGQIAAGAVVVGLVAVGVLALRRR